MVFHDSLGDTATFPTVVIQVGAEFQIGRTKTKFLYHSKATIENFARINGRTIRNSPVVVAILHSLPYPGRAELVGDFGNPDQLVAGR